MWQAVLASGVLGFLFLVAVTLLPAIIYIGTVVLYVVKRKSLRPSKGFALGRWEIPVIIVALIWLVFELLLFRDSSFVESWVYVLLMLALGAVYFAYLLLTRGAKGLVMPDMHSIDAELTADASGTAKGRHAEGTHRR